ncbi:MAG: hypothetical protein IPQ07_23740 [Myxococcales bacterium]|nr:hypothetical protein [Myxococcales bacterium]
MLENATDKKMYKVLAAVPRHDGAGEWWMKVGSGFPNRDDSLTIYLDAVPTHGTGKSLRLVIRPLDARDLERREAYRAGTTGGRSLDASSSGSSASESTPF